MQNYRNKYILLSILFLIVFPTITHAQSHLPAISWKQSIAPEKNYVEGEVIVKYKDTTVTTKAEESQSKELIQTLNRNSQAHDIIVEDNIDELNIAKVTSDDKTTEELIEKLSKNEAVEIVEPNYIKTPSFVPNDTYFSHQWAHRNTGQSVGGVSGTNDADIDTVEMWDIADSGSADTVVAIIDSGTDYNHMELSANMWDGASCVDENNNPISGGCPNHGWNYVNDNNDPNDAGDEEGHGTLVSSIVASNTNNNSEGAGMSRYNHIKIMAIRFDFDVYSELKAIDFARHNGAKVINASFGGGEFSQIEKNAIDAFPGIVVTASGNGGGDDIGDDNDVTPSYPCNYTSSNIICVAATDQDDNLADFSNYGPTSVDIAAPGTKIFGIYKGSHVYGSGTSFSTPFVSGTVALMYAHNSSASTSTIKNTLLASSDHISSLNNISCSRRLNAYNSLQNTINTTIPTESCSLPVYRFWSDTKQGHFYTISETEKNFVINNYPDNIWKYEGIAFNALDGNADPVYRFWSDQHQHHFYTISETEKNFVINNYPDNIWKYEGIVYYAYKSQVSDSTPLYRFWSDTKQGHFYTSSLTEKQYIETHYPSNIWRYERIAYYVK